MRLAVLLVAVATLAILGAEEPAKPVRIRSVSDLPAGTALAAEVARLDPAVQASVLAKLDRVPVGDLASIHVSVGGALRYHCSFGERIPLAKSAPRAPVGPKAAPIPVTSELDLHSKPGAGSVIYLDFNGETVTNTHWNDELGGNNNGNLTDDPAITVTPFTLDADATTWNDVEQQYITDVWRTVAEDYYPFDVDVTTVRPGGGYTLNSNSGEHRKILHMMIHPETDVHSPVVVVGALGIAYLGIFDSPTIGDFRPAWAVYRADFPASSVGLICAHELGHNFSLRHHGGPGGGGSPEYYPGHGVGETSWGPIMGNPLLMNVTQWSHGEYANATNAGQDDLAVIGGQTGARGDDFPDTDAGALAASATLGSGPTIAGSGFIGTRDDKDVLVFVNSTGPVSITASPLNLGALPRGGNLDIRMRIRDRAGAIVADAFSDASSTATFNTTNLTGGQYFVEISASGQTTAAPDPSTGWSTYGSIGQWSITGTIVPGKPTLRIANVAATSEKTAGRITVTANLPFTKDTTVLYQIEPLTATEGVDYVAPPGFFTFPAGVTTSYFTFSAIDDNIAEGEEFVMARLKASSDYTLVDQFAAKVAIIDDDLGAGSSEQPSKKHRCGAGLDGAALVLLACFGGVAFWRRRNQR